MALLRPRRVLSAVAVLALGALLAACGSSAPVAPPPSQGLVVNRPTPQHVGLVDQDGRHVSLAALRGKVVVLAPFLSLCQDECPLVTAAYVALERDVRAAGLGSRVAFVEATVDPGRDTSARVSPPTSASSAPTGSCGPDRRPPWPPSGSPSGWGTRWCPRRNRRTSIGGPARR